MINFVFDHVTDKSNVYPNLAKPGLSSSDFDCTEPRVTPVRLLTYLKEYNIPWQAWLPDQAPQGSWYPIGLSWYDFLTDYLDLLPFNVKTLVQKKHIKLLFYYHEGDNPGSIKSQLDFLGSKHQLPKDYYLFVSGNTASEFLENFLYFSDLELFFKNLNKTQTLQTDLIGQRPYKFTALSRTHKWWRATAMADLHRCDLLKQSLWSYNTECNLSNDDSINCIRLASIKGLEEYLDKFIKQGPYFCDCNDHAQHNNHQTINTDLYTQSYCHIVIETLFDAGQSGGAFITEKTYKAIKYGQPFVIVGTVGSLETLRRAGYRTFDHAIDNRYDLIYDNTQRWLAVRQAIAKIQSQDMHTWFESCRDDIIHNQNHYLNNFPLQLNKLINCLSGIDTV